MTDGVTRARKDLAEGRPWSARTRLNGVLAHRQDIEVLDLLATVHHEMGDLPAAGAIWFATGRDDEAAQRSVEAWKEFHRNDAALWRSIPGPIRRSVHSKDLEELKGAAMAATKPQFQREVDESRWEDIVFFGVFFVVVGSFLVMAVIGMWTVGRWIWG
ncbi:hypothetical protein LL946_04675 [Knoellia locipacati]|uniref:DUF6584 family protein n=1 Tax=Knoellia locipacati TaxID=882824 RepID=UPI00384F8EF5